MITKDTIEKSRFFEGCGKEGPIRCIFFCEFHPTAGPKIICQVPEDYIAKDRFEAVSVYLIPKPQLLGSTLTITTHEIKILGFPVRIDNKKYARNAYYFNVCFVCDSWARTVQYESIVKKLSNFLMSLEIENHFLSQRESNKFFTDRLLSILSQIFHDLNTNGMCTLTEGSCSTHLKVIKLRNDPVSVLDHQVPVFIESLDNFQVEQWDLTTQQVLPFVDGIDHVSKIAAQADVENNLVKTCLQNLVYYMVVSMVPIFQYSNSYSPTPQLRKLTLDSQLRESCLKTVAKTSWQLPQFRDVFKMYCSMSPETSVKDLCIRYNPSSLKIDERKLIQFGLVEGLIRRIHKYPVLLSNNIKEENGEASFLYEHFTGLLSVDEICCNLNLSCVQLEKLLEKDPNVIIMCK